MRRQKRSRLSRRRFVARSISAMAGLSLGHSSFAGGSFDPGPPFTVKQVIDVILKEIPGQPVLNSVDTLKAGVPEQQVTGIVSTMFATIAVIRKAVELKANFIIAHEPTFYNHLDDTGWLEEHDVYRYKRGLLDRHGIAVWRFHDYWHRHFPDGVRSGVLQTLHWQKYAPAENSPLIMLPESSLGDIITHVKARLGIETVRYIGQLKEKCRKVLIMPGASGGRSQIAQVQKLQPDVLICGEVAEWETSEYIRDLRAFGKPVSLILLGHSQSEEPGMRWLVEWLRPRLPGIAVTHLPSGNPFTFA